MRGPSIAQIASAAALAVFGVSGISMARPADETGARHFMAFELPGGGVARITYFGNVAPHIVVDPQVPAYVAAPAYVGADPFVALDRMAAEMDAETSILMREAATMAAQPMPGPGDLVEANMTDAPAGAISTTYVASFGGRGVCTQSVQVLSQGPGLRPRVVSQSSGDCGPMAPLGQPARRVRMYVPAESGPAARTVPVRADSQANTRPNAGMLRPAVIYTPAD